MSNTRRSAVLPSVKLAVPLVGALALASGTAAGADGQAPPQEHSEQPMSVMKVNIDVEGTTVVSTLDDSPTARDFVSLLPLTLTLKDYHSTEKVSDLPRKLSTEGAPAGVDPSPGDIAYYAPWGNLAIYYKDFGYSTGLVKLGVIASGGEVLNVAGSVKVTIRLAE